MEGLLFIALLVGIFIFLGLIIVYGNAQNKKRTEAFKDLALTLGFTFEPQALSSNPYPEFNFQLFNTGRSRKLTNVLSKTLIDGTQILIGDYYYVIGSGKSTQIWQQTVFTVSGQDLNWPTYRLEPEVGFIHGIGKLFGLKDINFDHYPQFSKMYLLRGEDEAHIRDRFNGQIVQWFEQHPKVSSEAQSQGGRTVMLLWKRGQLVKPEESADFVAMGQELWQRFQGY